jgi:hypothetical protein
MPVPRLDDATAIAPASALTSFYIQYAFWLPVPSDFMPPEFMLPLFGALRFTVP